MPRSVTGCAFALAAALFVLDYANAEEEGDDAVKSTIDEGSTAVGGDIDRGHVDFSVGETGEAQSEIKGQGHVNFAAGTEPSESERDNGHEDFSAAGTGDDQSDGHVDFSVDPAGAHAVDVDILPGESGAELCGRRGTDRVGSSAAGTDSATNKGDGHVDFSTGATDPASGDDQGQGHVVFRVAVRPDGSIEVNGQAVAVCDPAEGCRITLSWVPGSGTVVVRVEDAVGVAYAGQHPMAEPPEQIRLEAAEVRSLAVERQ